MTYSDDTAWAANTYEDGEVKKKNLEKLKTDQEQSSDTKIYHFLCGKETWTLFIGSSLPAVLLGWDLVRERAYVSTWTWIVRYHL